LPGGRAPSGPSDRGNWRTGAPAGGLVNFDHLKSIKRDKVLEAAIHRDFQQMLAYSEKTINQKAYKLAEDARNCFPSPNADSQSDALRKLDAILSERPWLAHILLFDAEKGYLFRSQPRRLSDPDFPGASARRAAPHALIDRASTWPCRSLQWRTGRKWRVTRHHGITGWPGAYR
jgi:hypothetical protein